MAVTVHEPPDDEPVDDLDGHTIEELADYLDVDRFPRDESIEASTACQHALAALARLRAVTREVLQDPRPADREDERWVSALMARIAIDARAGHDITLERGATHPRIVITEGAAKALIRRTGDEIPSMLVGRVDLTGDFTDPGSPLTATVEVTIVYAADIPATIETFRTAVAAALERHAAFPALTLDVTVQDLQAPMRADA